MMQLEQMEPVHKSFVDFVDKHIPEGQDSHIIPVSEAPWDSLSFQRLQAVDEPSGLCHYATLRTRVAEYTVEVLSVSVDPQGEFDVGSDSDNVSSSRYVEELDVPKFMNFFDRLIGAA